MTVCPAVISLVSGTPSLEIKIQSDLDQQLAWTPRIRDDAADIVPLVVVGHPADVSVISESTGRFRAGGGSSDLTHAQGTMSAWPTETISPTASVDI